MMIDKSIKHNCRYCGKQYKRIREGHLYCSTKCRVYAHRIMRKEMIKLGDGTTIRSLERGEWPVPVINIKVDTEDNKVYITCYCCNHVSEFDISIFTGDDSEKIITCKDCGQGLLTVTSLKKIE